MGTDFTAGEIGLKGGSGGGASWDLAELVVDGIKRDRSWLPDTAVRGFWPVVCLDQQILAGTVVGLFYSVFTGVHDFVSRFGLAVRR